MDTKQAEKKKVVIGYDLTDEYAQISYFFLEQDEPDTLKAYQGEKYNIPVCLCKKHGINQWYYGQQAVKSEQEGKGTLISGLLSLAVSSDEITVDDQVIATKDLLVLFVKKCLGMLGLLIEGFEVECLMITLDELTEKSAALMEQLKGELPYDEDRILIQTHEESLFYYLVNQKKELWNHDVVVFDFASDYLKSYYFTLNRKTMPQVALIEKKVYSDFAMPFEERLMIDRKRTFASLDQKFLTLLEDFTDGKLISSVYLIGKGFEGEWYQESLAFLCRTRRVFGGNNLYSKGACYAAKEKRGSGQLAGEYLFLGDDKLKFNIGVLSLEDGNEVCCSLLDAGINWYEARCEKHFLLDEGDTLEFVMTSLYGEKSIRQLKLEGLAKRPPRMTRLCLQLEMQNEHELHVHVKDEGFGNFFLSSDKEWDGRIEV